MSPDSEKKHILIVEDNQEQAMALAMFLKGNGYIPRVAFDATLGIMALHQIKTDLIILDLGLPGGGGFFMLDNLKKNTLLFGIPVFVLTAKIENGLEQKAREKGAINFFTKPCDTAKLLDAIKTAIS
ncbi:MAG: response regulator [Kiritimatiellia bacterium]